MPQVVTSTKRYPKSVRVSGSSSADAEKLHNEEEISQNRRNRVFFSRKCDASSNPKGAASNTTLVNEMAAPFQVRERRREIVLKVKKERNDLMHDLWGPQERRRGSFVSQTNALGINRESPNRKSYHCQVTSIWYMCTEVWCQNMKRTLGITPSDPHYLMVNYLTTANPVWTWKSKWTVIKPTNSELRGI